MYVRMHRDGRWLVASINLPHLRDMEARHRLRVMFGQEKETRVDTTAKESTDGR